MVHKTLTIALGMNIQAGPFGGGNQFARNIKQYLTANGHTVVDSLEHPAIDWIIITSLKPWTRSSGISLSAARHYRASHPQTRIVLRVNECDERKGQWPLLNELIRRSMRQVDYTVFVSEWLRQHITRGEANLLQRSSAICNGVDDTVFKPDQHQSWNTQEKVRLVTHHWSASWYKGWDLYNHIDELLSSSLQNKVEFTFIGHYPTSVKAKYIKFIKPLSGHELAAELKRHHLYVTGSQFEPGAMHPLEAIRCGLPVLYRESGSLAEYVGPYGIGFPTIQDFSIALKQAIADYPALRQKTTQYTYSFTDMAKQYVQCMTANHAPRAKSYSITWPLLTTIFARDSLAAWRAK